MAHNPVLAPSGVAGVPTIKPAFTASGFAPAIKRLASDYSAWLMETASAHAGQRGLLRSSGYEDALSRAGSEGFDKAVNTFERQQQTFSPYVQSLLNAKLNENAQPDKLPWWKKSIIGAAQGAAIGGQVGGGQGAGVGAITGAIAGPSIY